MEFGVVCDIRSSNVNISVADKLKSLGLMLFLVRLQKTCNKYIINNRVMSQKCLF